MQHAQHPNLLSQHPYIRSNLNIPLKHVKHLKHTLVTCAFSTAQHLYAAWEKGGSSTCGVHRRQQQQQRDAARRQHPYDWEREPDPPGSHSCQPCCAGLPVTRAASAIVPPCRGPLGPPCCGPLTSRPLFTMKPLRCRVEMLTCAAKRERGRE
jgi:hypothetical protein